MAAASRVVADPTVSAHDIATAMASYLAADGIEDILTVLDRACSQAPGMNNKNIWQSKPDPIIMLGARKLIIALLTVAPTGKLRSVVLQDACKILMLGFVVVVDC